jgi:hypothetical protein
LFSNSQDEEPFFVGRPGQEHVWGKICAMDTPIGKKSANYCRSDDFKNSMATVALPEYFKSTQVY